MPMANADNELYEPITNGDEPTPGAWQGAMATLTLHKKKVTVTLGAAVALGVVGLVVVTSHNPERHKTGGGTNAPGTGAETPAPFGVAGEFPGFVLARFWDPPAARRNGTGPQTNLTLHGVWPQYDEYMCERPVGSASSTIEKCKNSASKKESDRHGWPQYCGADHPATWRVMSSIDPSVRERFASQWSEYAPAYVDASPHNFATHEWTKHGTCSAPAPPNGEYTPADVVALQERYFQLQLDLMREYPTPVPLQECAQHPNGVALTYWEIRDFFDPEQNDAVALHCDNVSTGNYTGAGRLTMVSMCFDSNWQNHSLPALKKCPQETCLSSFYDNGCEKFHTILVDGPA